MSYSWPLSKNLLKEILNDRISDLLVSQLVWERLDYRPSETSLGIWCAGPTTPEEWRECFPEAPQVIIHRRASVQLTRSIPKRFKQALKTYLLFDGYRIDELYPRRTRRATAVNWLLAWLLSQEKGLPEEGAMPPLLDPPEDPTNGHPGDLPVQ